jgi:RNA polymerase sigma-70 factor (ECF subfamily)
MDAEAREGLEKDLRSRWEAQDYGAVATEAIRAYGPEIFGFLVALHRDQGDASDVFSTFTENLWKGLPKFGWQCTLRAWAYTIARNASHRFRRDEKRHVRGRAPLTGSSAVDEVAVKVRTETVEYLKTEQKDRFSALRESLPEEDQMLLILRVDRRLSWDELARIMGEKSEKEEEEEDVAKESARLRKRFQLVKEKLRAMGEKAGLIPKKEEP